MRSLIIFLSAVLTACTSTSTQVTEPADTLPPIRVTDGFTASVFHPGLGATRHIAVRDNGDVYIAREFRIERKMFGQQAAWGSLIALRDSDGDGAADIVATFGPTDMGDSVRIHNDFLYFSSDQVVYRMPLDDNLVPQTVAEPLAGGFPMTGSHGTKTLAFDGAGNMYVNSGVPTNNCETKRMTKASPGMD
ncbi:MAG: hypothetical protein ACR2QG_11370, partial [Gammaproteobacteria bacterium]